MTSLNEIYERIRRRDQDTSCDIVVLINQKDYQRHGSLGRISYKNANEGFFIVTFYDGALDSFRRDSRDLIFFSRGEPTEEDNLFLNGRINEGLDDLLLFYSQLNDPLGESSIECRENLELEYFALFGEEPELEKSKA